MTCHRVVLVMERTRFVSAASVHVLKDPVHVFVAFTPSGEVWALRMVLPLICLDHLSACYFCVLLCHLVLFFVCCVCVTVF